MSLILMILFIVWFNYTSYKKYGVPLETAISQCTKDFRIILYAMFASLYSVIVKLL